MNDEKWRLTLIDRYQNQNFLVKLWRCRHYIPVIHRAIKNWIRFFCFTKNKDDDTPSSFKFFLSMEIGIAQIEMKYWYTTEECDINWRTTLNEMDEDNE